MAGARSNRRDDSPRARVGLITIRLGFPGCASLREKKSRVNKVLEEIRREFSCSATETGGIFSRDSSIIAAAIVGREVKTLDRVMDGIVAAVERHDLRLEDFETEVI